MQNFSGELLTKRILGRRKRKWEDDVKMYSSVCCEHQERMDPTSEGLNLWVLLQQCYFGQRMDLMKSFKNFPTVYTADLNSIQPT
jgi:hypothetical protein